MQKQESRYRVPPGLDIILQRDGFILFISGRKESGKTDFGLGLGEYCFDKAYRTNIATNIKTESYKVQQQITNFPDFDAWIKGPGRKLFILDEAGKHIPKMGFMTKKTKLIMEIIQLIRHYDAGLIGIAPSDSFIDNNFLNTDILDARIRKVNKHMAIIRDYLQNDTYFLSDIDRTSVKFNSKDIAEFTLEKNIPIETMSPCCQVATYYARGASFGDIGKTLNLHKIEVKRLLQEHLKHAK